MFYCHDEKAGFEKFYQLLDEFQQRDKSLDGDWFDDLARETKSEIKKQIITRG